MISDDIREAWVDRPAPDMASSRNAFGFSQAANDVIEELAQHIDTLRAEVAGLRASNQMQAALLVELRAEGVRDGRWAEEGAVVIKGLRAQVARQQENICRLQDEKRALGAAGRTCSAEGCEAPDSCSTCPRGATAPCPRG